MIIHLSELDRSNSSANSDNFQLSQSNLLNKTDKTQASSKINSPNKKMNTLYFNTYNLCEVSTFLKHKSNYLLIALK
jgi:hypothetical protein